MWGMQMNVSLTPELERLVHERVETGRYSSASEVVREALRVLENRDQARELHRDRLRADVARGLQSLREGHLQSGDDVFDQLADGLAREDAPRP